MTHQPPTPQFFEDKWHEAIASQIVAGGGWSVDYVRLDNANNLWQSRSVIATLLNEQAFEELHNRMEAGSLGTITGVQQGSALHISALIAAEENRCGCL